MLGKRIILSIFWGKAKSLHPVATLKFVAATMDLTSAYLGKLVRGEHPWTAEQMQNCADALDLPVADLFEEVEVPTKPAPESTSVRTAADKEKLGE